MSLVKLLVVGDAHLGRRSYGLTERVRDHAAVLPQINAYVDEHEPDVVCVLGDTFDAPSVDSYSCDAFRRFVERIPDAANVIALTGNHDRERLDLGMTRVRSLGGERVGGGGEYQLRGLRISAYDWMPATAIAREIDALPTEPRVDILCLHQSVEDLKPEIGEPEVRLEQLRGRARLVLVGDVHVNKTVDAGDETTVISVGSTELCSSDEDPNKVVKLITYDSAAHRVVSVVDLPLRTRRPVWWTVDQSEDGFDTTLQLIRDGAHSPPLGRYLHFVSYAPQWEHRLSELQAAVEEHGDLLVATALPRTAERQEFADAKISAGRELEEVLAERHSDPAERAIALSLWRQPEQAQTILAELEAESSP